MIDTHCHLTYPQLSSQLGAVLERARIAGVRRMITIGTSADDAKKAIALCREADHLRCVIGIHPNHTAEAAEGDMAVLESIQSDPTVIALGEMGLDYHWDIVPRDRQRLFFESQLALAQRVNKPVVIHCREAVDDALAVLRGFAGVAAVFHCFTGTASEAERILAAGYYLGFTGPVTFKKNEELRRVVQAVPLEKLLLETDSPYLSPEPVRSQKVNEPAFVMHIARMAAKLKGISLEAMEAAVDDNVARLFGW